MSFLSKSINNSNFSLYFCLGLVAILIGSMFFIRIPGNTLFINTLQDSGHAIIFASLSILFISILRRIQYPVKQLFSHYILVFACCFCLGVLIEYLQSFIGRQSSWSDVMLDMIGTIAGFFLISTPTIRQKFRIIYACIGITIIILSFTKPITWAYASWQRNQQFPILGDFESFASQLFYEENNNGQFYVVSTPKNWSNNTGQVGLMNFSTEGKWSGFKNIEPYPDWRGYQSITFEIYSEEKQTITLGFKISDTLHNRKYTDRFNSNLNIKPGINQFLIPLADIKIAPKTREMNLAKIDKISWFVGNTPRRFSLYIDNIRLH